MELFAPHATPDPDFTNVPGHVSNPENPQVFDAIIALTNGVPYTSVLTTNDGASQRELADVLHLARPTVTKMVQALERSGAVERRPAPGDQRLTRVYLTTSGRAVRCSPPS